MASLRTVGHSTADAAPFAELLGHSGVQLLVDVRSFPGSRKFPHFGREQMQTWLPSAGVEYRWEPRLGGRRKKIVADSAHTALREASFRNYADYMTGDPAFETALDEVLAEADQRVTAIMCSEAVYWRCHRRLICDAAVLLREADVLHLGHDGRLTPHALTSGVRLAPDGSIAYDLGQARLTDDAGAG
jgi:uncharacterized protein (DUF488 family)